MVSDTVLSHYEQGSLWEELKAQCKALPYRITYTTQIPRNFGYLVRFADVASSMLPLMQAKISRVCVRGQPYYPPANPRDCDLTVSS